MMECDCLAPSRPARTPRVCPRGDVDLTKDAYKLELAGSGQAGPRLSGRRTGCARGQSVTGKRPGLFQISVIVSNSKPRSERPSG
jgi:hypothetical protein